MVQEKRPAGTRRMVAGDQRQAHGATAALCKNSAPGGNFHGSSLAKNLFNAAGSSRGDQDSLFGLSGIRRRQHNSRSAKTLGAKGGPAGLLTKPRERMGRISARRAQAWAWARVALRKRFPEPVDKIAGRRGTAVVRRRVTP